MKNEKFFEAVFLDDASKEQLCRELLGEFGVTHIRRTPRGELVHSCCLPDSTHKNGDRNPSASLNFRKLTYKCLGCGSSGGLLWFIGTCRGEDSQRARAWLEKEAGLGQTVMELPKLLQMIDQIYQPTVDRRPPIPTYDDSILDPWIWPTFHPYLTDGLPEYGVQGRQIPEETLRHFRIGYAEHYGFDRSERIIIPLWWHQKLVGWQARHIGPTEESDKYRNSPDFPRDQAMFNYHTHSRCVLVESPMSVLRHYHHVPDMIASYGADLADEQVRLLHPFADVVLWFDNDNAGWKATQRVGEALERYNRVWVAPSTWVADPADLSDQEVDELVSAAVPFSLWAAPRTLHPWKG